MLNAIAPPRASSAPDLNSVDLVLRLVELLAASREPRGVTDVARELGISKPRAHRHLRALVQRGYARQDPRTEGYEVGIKVLVAGRDGARPLRRGQRHPPGDGPLARGDRPGGHRLGPGRGRGDGAGHDAGPHPDRVRHPPRGPARLPCLGPWPGRPGLRAAVADRRGAGPAAAGLERPHPDRSRGDPRRGRARAPAGLGHRHRRGAARGQRPGRAGVRPPGRGRGRGRPGRLDPKSFRRRRPSARSALVTGAAAAASRRLGWKMG